MTTRNGEMVYFIFVTGFFFHGATVVEVKCTTTSASAWGLPRSRVFGVTHRGFCHELSMEGRNKWLVGGLEHEFYDFPKSWDDFFQSDFHSIIFQEGCFTKPPTR